MRKTLTDDFGGVTQEYELRVSFNKIKQRPLKENMCNFKTTYDNSKNKPSLCP